jgi:hypothetical protein
LALERLKAGNHLPAHDGNDHHGRSLSGNPSVLKGVFILYQTPALRRLGY